MNYKVLNPQKVTQAQIENVRDGFDTYQLAIKNLLAETRDMDRPQLIRFKSLWFGVQTYRSLADAQGIMLIDELPRSYSDLV